MSPGRVLGSGEAEIQDIPQPVAQEIEGEGRVPWSWPLHPVWYGRCVATSATGAAMLTTFCSVGFGSAWHLCASLGEVSGRAASTPLSPPDNVVSAAAPARLRVNQQNDGGKDGYQEFHQDPIASEQAPLGTQCLDKPGYQRGEAQRDDDEPGGQPHREIGGSNHLSILAGQTGDGEAGSGPIG